jgi:hypothetical protein
MNYARLKNMFRLWFVMVNTGLQSQNAFQIMLNTSYYSRVLQSVMLYRLAR